MVNGLDLFRKHFADHDDKYVVIGGTACMLVMEDVGIDFRATKDLDIVLCIEALNTEFVAIFWQFIEAGGYQNRQRSTGKEIFYRFDSPVNKAFPAMLELFSRIPDQVNLDVGGHLTPIPMDKSVASLSAILLDDNYYSLIHSGKRKLVGISIVGVEQLIPLKARAWGDLTKRKKIGERVDEKDIRKHRKDVFQLYQLLSIDQRILLPASVKEDLHHFIEVMKIESSIDLKAIGLKNTSVDDILANLTLIYDI